MKKTLLILSAAVILSIPTVKLSHASDWDKAGKALAIIEGLRIVTGGNVDPIGNIAGIHKNRDYEDRYHHKRKHRRHGKYRRKHRKHFHNDYCSVEKVWVPKYVWKKKYIPEQEVYSEEYGGTICIEGHYIRYKEEAGGYWKKQYTC